MLITVSFWIGFGGWAAQFYAGSPLSSNVGSNWHWLRVRGPSHGSCFMKFHRVQYYLCSCWMCTLSYWVTSIIIHHTGMSYHQHSYNIQIYISTPGTLSNAVDILPWYLEAVKVWMGNKRLQGQSWQDEVALGLGSSGSRDLWSLLLNGLALPQADLACNLGSSYDFCVKSRWKT